MAGFEPTKSALLPYLIVPLIIPILKKMQTKSWHIYAHGSWLKVWVAWGLTFLPKSLLRSMLFGQILKGVHHFGFYCIFNTKFTENLPVGQMSSTLITHPLLCGVAFFR
jgi:hypothetical protein